MRPIPLLTTLIVAILLLVLAFEVGRENGTSVREGTDRSGPRTEALDPARVDGRSGDAKGPGARRRDALGDAVRTIEVVDPEGTPLAGARMWIGAADQVFEESAAGRIEVPEHLGSAAESSSCVVWAPGCEPEIGLDLQDRTRVTLWPDPVIPVRVLRQEGGAPAEGVVLDLHFAPEGEPSGLPTWFQEARTQMGPTRFLTDGDGRARLPVSWLGRRDRTMRARFDQAARGRNGLAGVLRVAAPRGPAAVVPLEFNLGWDEAGQPREIVLTLASESSQVLLLVDAAHEALPRTRVVLRQADTSTELWTDDRGLLEVPRPILSQSHYGLWLEIDLGGGRWFRSDPMAKEEVGGQAALVVDWNAWSGTLDAEDPQAWELACAHGVPVGFRQGMRPEPRPWSRLAWILPDVDGSFRIDLGWQGDWDLLCVRHRATGEVVSADGIDGTEGLRPRVPGIATVVMRASPGAELRPGRFELRRVERRGLESEGRFFRPEQLPLTWQHPAGEFFLLWHEGGSELVLRRLTIHAPHTEVEIPLPRVRRYRGVVEGTIRGPLAGVQLSLQGFLPNESEVWEVQETSGGGAFDLRAFGEGPWQFQLRWPDRDRGGWNRWQLLREDLREIPAEPVRIVLDEAALAVRRRPSRLQVLESLGHIEYELFLYDPATGEIGDGANLRGLDDAEFLELVVPSGDYLVRGVIDGFVWFEDRHLALATGEQREAHFDETLGRVAFDFEIPEELEGEIRMTLRGSRGELRSRIRRIWRRQPGQNESAWSGLRLPPDRYTARLEYELRDADGTTRRGSLERVLQITAGVSAPFPVTADELR